jgi:hypothetical protein
MISNPMLVEYFAQASQACTPDGGMKRLPPQILRLYSFGRAGLAIEIESASVLLKGKNLVLLFVCTPQETMLSDARVRPCRAGHSQCAESVTLPWVCGLQDSPAPPKSGLLMYLKSHRHSNNQRCASPVRSPECGARQVCAAGDTGCPPEIQAEQTF